jgi:hypothetical protein
VEASGFLRLEVGMTFGFSLLPDAGRFEDRPFAGYGAIIADLRPGLEELRGRLAAAVRESKQPVPVEITGLEVREGSIVFELFAVLSGVGSWISFYGGLMQGLEYLARTFREVFEGFLRPYVTGPVHLQQTTIVQGPITSVGGPASVARTRREVLETYLIASHAALLLLLGAVVIVLLARSG